MDKKNLNPKQNSPVIRKTSISLPELHEEQLTGGMGKAGDAIEPRYMYQDAAGKWVYSGFCSFDGDDAAIGNRQ